MRLKVSKAQSKRVALAALFVLTIVVTIYTTSAYYVAGSIIEVDGQLMWRTATRGSLFPIPQVPGNLQATISVYETDALIYTYLIKTCVLAAFTVLLWAVTVWSIKKARHRKNKTKTMVKSSKTTLFK
jgi:hypothetical protein